MNTTEIVLIGTIVLLTMFGYVKYKDLIHKIEETEEEVWEKASNEYVNGIEERIKKLEK